MNLTPGNADRETENGNGVTVNQADARIHDPLSAWFHQTSSEPRLSCKVHEEPKGELSTQKAAGDTAVELSTLPLYDMVLKRSNANPIEIL